MISDLHCLVHVLLLFLHPVLLLTTTTHRYLLLALPPCPGLTPIPLPPFPRLPQTCLYLLLLLTQTRMQFLQHLRRLTSAAQSITKVVVFLLKHSQPHQAQPTNHLPANPTTTTTGDPTTDKSSNATGSLTLSSLATTVTDANANPTTTTTTTTIAPTHEEADLWECIVEELGSERASINAKINIFYMLDSLLDHSLTANFPAWPAFIQRDLDKVLRFTVPTHLREGVLNRMSALQVSATGAGAAN